MENKFLIYYKPKVIIGFIVITVLILFWLRENLKVQLTIIPIVIALISLINKYLWKYIPFRWMFWVENFSGLYEGELEYSYQDNGGMIKTDKLIHRKIVKQSGSKINITSFTLKSDGSKSSESSNIGIYVDRHDDGCFRLIYNYLNEGDASHNLSPHYGTDVLKFIKKSKGERCLLGYYYTNRNPFQTRGQYIELKRISNNLTHDF